MLVVSCPSSTSSSPTGTPSPSLGACCRPSSLPWAHLPGMASSLTPSTFLRFTVSCSQALLRVLALNPRTKPRLSYVVMSVVPEGLQASQHLGADLCPKLVLLTCFPHFPFLYFMWRRTSCQFEVRTKVLPILCHFLAQSLISPQSGLWELTWLLSPTSPLFLWFYGVSKELPLSPSSKFKAV